MYYCPGPVAEGVTGGDFPGDCKGPVYGGEGVSVCEVSGPLESAEAGVGGGNPGGQSAASNGPLTAAVNVE